MEGLMVAIVIKHNFPEVERGLEQLHRDVRDQALVRAINRTIAPALPEMAREISREFNIGVNQVKERLVIKKAGFSHGRLRIEAFLESPSRRGRSTNLIHFVEKSVTLSAAAKRRKGGEGGSYTLGHGVVVSKALELRFKIKRGGPWKVIPGAFIANDGRTVFQREGKKRLPIKALQTIDVGQMFNAKRINDRVRKGMFDRFPGIFQHEAKFYTDRFNQKRASQVVSGGVSGDEWARRLDSYSASLKR